MKLFQKILKLPIISKVLTTPHRYTAFTLAEMLIVLGIIGIVAQMTIPTMIMDVQKQARAALLKKFFSSMNQAITMSTINNGPSSDWSYVRGGSATDALAFFNAYLASSMKYLKIDTSSSSPKVYFNDGTTMQIYLGSCVDMRFDVNSDQNPNVYGKDQFVFLFCNGSDATYWFQNPNINFGAYGQGGSITRAQALANCQNNPYTCSSLLIQDNWEFKQDYPY